MTIRIDGTNTTANPGITGTDTDTGLVYGTDEVKIVTGGTDRVTVDSSGNVGISTSSPTSPLEVHSGSGTNIIAKSTNGNGGFLNYSGLASNGTTTFSVNHNGTIYTAGGLNFGSVTSPVTSQTLDDYEEGTWTPTPTLGAASTSEGSYVKIGSYVYVAGYIGFANITSTTTMVIGNLPFTIEHRATGGVFSSYTDAGRTPNACYAIPNTTNLRFYASGGPSTVYHALRHIDLAAAGNQFFFGIGYRTNS